jgi:hypothetical protein
VPIFLLTSIDANHNDWRASSLKTACRVHAETEEEARELAHEEFHQASERQSIYETLPLSPWLSADRVKCEIDRDANLASYRKGCIEVPRNVGAFGEHAFGESAFGGEERWVAVREGEPLQTGAGAGGVSFTTTDAFSDSDAIAGVRAAGPKPTVASAKEFVAQVTGAPDTVRGTGTVSDDPSPPPITRQTAARVVANRAVLSFQAKSLIQTLDALLGPSASTAGRNSVSLGDALGLDDAEAKGELLEVLKELRDELRRFNDTLESGANTSQVLSLLKQGSLRDSALTSAGMLVGSTCQELAGLITATLGSLLDQSGLLDWDGFLKYVFGFAPVAAKLPPKQPPKSPDAR